MTKDFEQLTNPKESLATQTKDQVSDLKTLFQQYNDLLNQLESVRSALVKNEKSKIIDELVGCEVEIPILFVKQYKQGKCWYHVPAASYVLDKKNLLRWFETNPTHPIARDGIENPKPYKEMETRYIWYFFIIF